MTSGIRPTGDFCWINMITPQPDAARAFFAALLGWTYADMPGMGHVIRCEGHDLGGLFDQRHPNTPPGTRAYIGVMLKVDDADTTCERIRALGGTHKPPFHIGDRGRMAVCFDPTGGEFDLWQPGTGTGFTVDSGKHGAPSWFEALTTDVARAKTFYEKLFGWTSDTMQMPGFSYTSFKLGETWVAGMMAITPEMGAMHSHWGVYFTSRDVDASAQLAERLGATLCVPPRDIPGVGRFCGVISPQGVSFYLMTYAMR